MSDDLTKRRPQDSSKVNIHEPWEVNWWCAEFKCTKDQLIAAVKAVGVSAAAVRKHLSKINLVSAYIQNGLSCKLRPTIKVFFGEH
jgi:hypothetical protein